MKFNFTILVAIMMYSQLPAQIEWVELPVHNAENIQVVYKTETDRLIGYLDLSKELFVSDDFGRSWQLLVSLEDSLTEDFYYYESVKEGPDGSLYILIERSLYEIDEDQQSLILFFDLGFSFGLYDYFFLDDGSVVVLGGSSIQRYSSSGALLNSKDLGTFSDAWKLVKGVDDLHYAYPFFPVFFEFELIEFSSDLSFIEEDIAGETEFSYLVIDTAGVFYTNSEFSLDGRLWETYPDRISGWPTVTNTGHLHIIGTGFLNENKIFISKDGAQTFENHTLDFELIGRFDSGSTFPLGDDGVIYSNANCPGSLLHTQNGIDAWEDQSHNLNKGIPYASSVEAASEDLVVIEGCRFEEFLKTADGGWETVTIRKPEPVRCAAASGTASLPDGSLLTAKGCRSTDGGSNWMDFGEWITLSPDINSSGVYVLDNRTLFASYDSGESWEKKTFGDDFRPGFGFHVITSSEQIYTLEDSILYRYDFDGVFIDAITLRDSNLGIENLVASFDSNKVFLLERGSSKLIVYNEDSKELSIKSMPEKAIKIYVDPSDNLYLLSNNSLYSSADEGDTWLDITPSFPNLKQLTDVDVSWDGYLYVSTIGTPILKSISKVVQGSTSTAELEHSFLSVYPVPANDILNVSYSGSKVIKRYSLVDNTGSEVKTVNTSSMRVDEVRSGLYFLRIEFDDGSMLSHRVSVVK